MIGASKGAVSQYPRLSGASVHRRNLNTSGGLPLIQSKRDAITGRRPNRAYSPRVKGQTILRGPVDIVDERLSREDMRLKTCAFRRLHMPGETVRAEAGFDRIDRRAAQKVGAAVTRRPNQDASSTRCPSP